MIGLSMPLSFMLQLQMWMQLTVLMLLLNIILLIILIIVIILLIIMLIIMLKIKEKQSFKTKNSGSCYQWHHSVVGQLGPSPGTNELPIRPKNLKIRPPGYFFKLRSILMLPGLEIPLKSEKITKNWIYKRPGFQKMVKC